MRGSGRGRHIPGMNNSGKTVIWLMVAAFCLSATAFFDGALAGRIHGVGSDVLQPLSHTFQHPQLVGQRCPSSVIARARQRLRLPHSARAVGCRMVKKNGNRYWRVIFRDGNRQMAVNIRAG